GGFGGPGLLSRLVIDRDVTMSDKEELEAEQAGSKSRCVSSHSHSHLVNLLCDWSNRIPICLPCQQIPHGKKYDKKWLVPALQDICSIPYTPIQVSQCMSKRFDGSQQALDLTSIHTDPDLVSLDIKVVLNRKTNMEAVIKIIEENIPQLTSLNLSHNCIQRLDELSELVTKVPHLKALNLSHNDLKSEHELDKLKGLKLVELWLVRNPLCDLFKDPSSYVSAVCQKFPQLLKLDGNDLPPHIGFDVETPTTLPPCKVSQCDAELSVSVVVFCLFHRYYSVYDSGDRQSLLGAYHDEALLSLTTPYNVQNPSRSGLREYFKDSRNLKRTKDSTMRFHLLKHKRLNVVALLNELPKTQHDITSFTVDVNAYTVSSRLICHTLSYIIFVVDDKSKESTRAFSRVFITVPAVNSGLCIINDQLFIRMATTEQISRAFVAPAPTPSSSPVPTLTAPQQEMLSTFSLKSGMKLEWSLKCLQDNEWDLNKAAQIFTQLKTAGKIPDVAFLK
uniref:Nuclear RNA export factor 1-like n=1 Tax=Gouania willdenowi TaxID=441366 RepID=A0A8C5G389_GOUWI